MADVYLLYDKKGVLLYIGSSAQNALTRAKQHRSFKAWGGDICRVDFRHYATFQRACAVEERAIRLLDPMHNTYSVRKSAKYAPSRLQFHAHRAMWLDPLGPPYEAKRKAISADYGSEVTRGTLNGRFGWIGKEKPVPDDMKTDTDKETCDGQA